MKSIILSLVLFSSLNSFAKPESIILNCEVVSCVDVEKPTNDESWCEMTNTQNNVFQLSTDLFTTTADGKSLQLKQNDGDQFDVFVLYATSVESVKPGAVIQGSLSNGYWWADGEHLRSTIELSCVRE